MENRAREAVMNLLGEDTVWAGIELRTDPLYSRLSIDQITDYVMASLKIGDEWAKPFAGQSAYELTQHLGIKTDYALSDPGIRATFSTQRISINRKSLQHIADTLHSLLPISFQQVEAAAIAHEIFHYLEYQGPGPIHKVLLPPVVKQSGFMVRTKGWVKACREIAAHRFAKEVASVPNLPNVWDWLLAIREKRCSWSRLSALIDDTTKHVHHGMYRHKAERAYEPDFGKRFTLDRHQPV